MKTLVLAVAALVVSAPGGFATAATQVDCHAMFDKADDNRDGSVGGPELRPFVPSLIAAGVTSQSIEQMVIKADEFTENCMRDQLKDMQQPQ
jgi:predicted HAD superfamily phosphohydrolase